MPVAIRPAQAADIPALAWLLLQDAQGRNTLDPALWALAPDAQTRITEALTFALTAENQPFRQHWLVAMDGDRLVGVIHAMHLPVPPIYAAQGGDPGLILPETFATPDAPDGTIAALVDAAEAALRAAGARLLLATSVSDDPLRQVLDQRGYNPVTLYLSKSGLAPVTPTASIRPATEGDIDAIVTLSARHRAILPTLSDFWAIHPDADARFGNWMRKSLTLPDRDMLVDGAPAALNGYAVAQPASRLHFPPAHDISATGVIDDFFHRQFADPARMDPGVLPSTPLIRGAETAFAQRGITTAFVVCPAAWTSKIAALEDAGYRTAMTWLMKR